MLGSCWLQEYFIRHLDGCALDTESEKERVIKCLEAAIERRVCEVRESQILASFQLKSSTTMHPLSIMI